MNCDREGTAEARDARSCWNCCWNRHREFEALEQRLNAAEAALQSQQLQLETCGSIAEASLKLNGVFEAAQKAAEQYQQNVERLCQEKISAAESQAQEILARAKKAANQQ